MLKINQCEPAQTLPVYWQLWWTWSAGHRGLQISEFVTKKKKTSDADKSYISLPLFLLSIQGQEFWKTWKQWALCLSLYSSSPCLF